VLLRTERAELPLTSKTCPAWFALNPGGSGYYRWTLPGPQLQRLLKKGYGSLRPAERLALASNLTAALRSGALSAEEVLAALEPFARDPEPAVALEPAEFLKLVQDRYVDPAQRSRVQRDGPIDQDGNSPRGFRARKAGILFPSRERSTFTSS
jgi:hypothetical protein